MVSCQEGLSRASDHSAFVVDWANKFLSEVKFLMLLLD